MLRYFSLLLLFIYSFQQSKVYFTKEISPSKIVEMFKKLNVSLPGNIGLKVHTGELGGKYFLTPDFLQKIYDYTNGTFIECNTAYIRNRHTTAFHKEVLKIHGWVNNSRKADIMDEDPSEDYTIEVNNGKMIHKDYVGGHFKNYDSCLVLAHFKGHPVGGFGGALKQLSIGFASQAGKSYIHSAGRTTNWTDMTIGEASKENFTAAMGDAASAVVEHFRKKGNIAFINVLANISLHCDCRGPFAPEPKIRDFGILASMDPVAIDRACLDMIKNYTSEGTEELFDQIEKFDGENIIDVAEEHGIGSQKYVIVDVDDDEKKEDEDEEEKKDEEDKDNKNEDSGSLTVIIIVCVVFGIITVGIFAFILICFLRKPKEEVVGNDNEDDGVNEKIMPEN